MNGPIHYFDISPCPTLTSLCSHFTGKRLQSPYRSTVPLIDLVYNNPAEWRSLLEQIGASPEFSVYFEFGVPSSKPGGNPSQTDALLAADGKVWAIEAKWTEGIDPKTVRKRLSEPESDGGDPRITVSGWLTHLQPFASSPLDLEDCSDFIYQTIHRAASAAYTANLRDFAPMLVYLHFVPSPLGSSASTGHYISELTRLYNWLGRPADFPFRVIELQLDPTAAFEIIKDLDRHDHSTSIRVREALCEGPLFTFSAMKVTQI